jgi:hypothetical protein
MTLRHGFKTAFLAAALIAVTSCGVTAPSQACPTTCISPLVCDTNRQACVASMPAMGAGGGSAAGGAFAGGGTASAGNGLPCEVEALLSNSCTSCHGATLKNGANVRLLTRSDLLAPSPATAGVSVGQRCSTRMHQMVAAMPPAPDDPVANTALTAFDTWLAAGMPEGACSTGRGGGGSASAGGGTAGGGVAGGTAGGGGAMAGGSAGTGGGGAAVSPYCRSCTAAGQCGAATNFCLGSAATGNCGTDCSAGQACPTGASCVAVRNSAGATVGRNCFPTSGQCSGSAGGGSAGGGTAGGGTGGGAANACATNPDTFANFAGNFFATKCASCHHHTGEFTTPASILSTSRSRISSGNMPRLPTTITAAERARVLAWYDCGKRP